MKINYFKEEYKMTVLLIILAISTLLFGAISVLLAFTVGSLLEDNEKKDNCISMLIGTHDLLELHVKD